MVIVNKIYVGLDNGNCEWDNPDWRFQSTGEKWLEASEEDWLKYWSNNGTGQRPPGLKVYQKLAGLSLQPVVN